MNDQFKDTFSVAFDRVQSQKLDEIDEIKKNGLDYLKRRDDVDATVRDVKERTFTATIDRIRKEADQANALDDLNVTTSKAQTQLDIMIHQIESLPPVEKENHDKVTPSTTDPASVSPVEPTKPVVQKRIRTLHARQVITVSQWRIENDADIDRYIEKLRGELKAKLENVDEIDINF
ncbi:hypothetical protein [Lacticaseibacillus sp. GG6-2]